MQRSWVTSLAPLLSVALLLGCQDDFVPSADGSESESGDGDDTTGDGDGDDTSGDGDGDDTTGDGDGDDTTGDGDGDDTSGDGDGDDTSGDGDGDDTSGDGDGDDTSGDGDGDGDDTTGDGDGDGGDDTSGDGDGDEPISLCGPDPFTEPGEIKNGDNGQLNPAYTYLDLGDGRGLAGHHFYGDEVIEGAVFDVASQTWDGAQTLREVGPWFALRHTQMRSFVVPGAAYMLEDANASLAAHRYDLDTDEWSLELIELPEPRVEIEDAARTASGGLLVLLAAQADDDAPRSLYLVRYDAGLQQWQAPELIYGADTHESTDHPKLAVDSVSDEFMLGYMTQHVDLNNDEQTVFLHWDPDTQAWTHVLTAGFNALTLRAMNPGQFFVAPIGQRYFYSHDTGLSDDLYDLDLIFPDVAHEGLAITARQTSAYPEGPHLMYQTFDPANPDPDDGFGPLDLLAVPGSISRVHKAYRGAEVVFVYRYNQGGVLTTAVARHDDQGWSEPTILAEGTCEQFPCNFGEEIAVNDEGRALVTYRHAALDPELGDVRAALYLPEEGWQELGPITPGRYAIPVSFSGQAYFGVFTHGDTHRGRYTDCAL